MKSLWVMIQGDPVFMRRVNGWLAVFWMVMIPFSLWMGWLSSVIYVSALSLWALVSGHWSAWQAARVEVKQEEERSSEDRDALIEDVISALITKTDVQRSEQAAPAPTSSPKSLPEAV